MYDKIMVPTDGSGFDREALRVALRIAGKSSAKVCLVRVASSAGLLGMAPSLDGIADGIAISAEALQDERNRAQKELEWLATECRSTSDADIAVDLLDGPVAEILEGYAQRNKFDLIVISSHGRSGMSRFSLGSVTDSLIRHTHIPVLVVKQTPSYLNRPAQTFKRIVVPLDGSTLAEQIIPRVCSLATLEQADVTLLHVMVPQNRLRDERADPARQWWDGDVAFSRAYLARVAARMRREGVPVTTDIVVGDNVAQAIADYAGRERPDLVAITTHGRGGLARMLRGSVADAVTRSSKTSMLVLRPEKSAEKNGSTTHNEELHLLEPEPALS